MISAMAGTSASAVAAAPLAERYAACPPSRADLPDPDAVKLVPPRCVHAGIHYPRPLFARRVAASRAPFSARSFLVHGETSAAAARRWTAAGTPLLVRGRCSPSEVLPRLPITRASFCLSHSSRRFSVFRPYDPLSLSFRPPSSCLLATRFFSHLLSLPSSCTLPFLSSPPPLTPGFDLLLLPSCQRLTFLQAF